MPEFRNKVAGFVTGSRAHKNIISFLFEELSSYPPLSCVQHAHLSEVLAEKKVMADSY